MKFVAHLFPQISLPVLRHMWSTSSDTPRFLLLLGNSSLLRQTMVSAVVIVVALCRSWFLASLSLSLSTRLCYVKRSVTTLQRCLIRISISWIQDYDSVWMKLERFVQCHNSLGVKGECKVTSSHYFIKFLVGNNLIWFFSGFWRERVFGLRICLVERRLFTVFEDVDPWARKESREEK